MKLKTEEITDNNKVVTGIHNCSIKEKMYNYCMINRCDVKAQLSLGFCIKTVCAILRKVKVFIDLFSQLLS